LSQALLDLGPGYLEILDLSLRFGRISKFLDDDWWGKAHL